MFTALPTPKEMALWDHAAIEMGLPELMLMENAAREAFHVIRQTVGSLKKKQALIFMGSGNNGGDAACLARHLLDAGASVRVLHTRPLASYRGVTGQHLRLARRCGVVFEPVGRWFPQPSSSEADMTSPQLRSCALLGAEPDILIDGLLGTGFSGNLRPLEQHLVNVINKFAARTQVFSLDIPSGLSGLTGRALPIAVQAYATITFEAPKPGLILPEAVKYTGKLHIRPIGIPLTIRQALPASCRLLGEDLGSLLPCPTPFWHKGTAGRVLVIGGSVCPLDLTGAPHLAAMAALRSGAGLVSVAAPAGFCAAIKANCPDIMLRPLGIPTTSDWSSDLAEQLAPFIAEKTVSHSYDAVILGPGMGRTPGAKAFVQALLALPERLPMVIDADALNALTNSDSPSSLLHPDDVLTPHPGEAAALLEYSPRAVQENRFAALDALRQIASAVWILKGAGTLIGAPNLPVVISPYAVPSLAVGGSGDVLSGCLGTLLAQREKLQTSAEQLGLSPSALAAYLAVLVHARAGQILTENYPQRGNTASEIAACLPEARKHLLDQKQSDT